MTRWLRVLICLFLVCCILVNCSPIRAEAISGATVAAVVGSVAAAPVVAGVMTALGVMPDSANTSVFEEVVNACTDALTRSGVFIDGAVTVLQLLSDGLVKNHVNQGIVESILDWLLSSGTVSVEKGVAAAGMKYYGDRLFHEIPDAPAGCSYTAISTYGSADNFCVFYSNYPFHVNDKGNGKLLLLSSQSNIPIYFRSYYSDTGWGDLKSLTTSVYTIHSFQAQPVWADHDLYYKYDDTLILFPASAPSSALIDTTIATGLVAGQIGTDIETDYETWVQEGVVAVDFGIGYVDDPNTNNDDDDDDDGDTEIGPTVPVDPSVPDSPSTPGSPVSPTTNPSPWWQNNKWLNVGGGILGWELAELTQSLLNQTQTDVQTGYGDPQQTVDTSLFQNNGTGNGSGDNTGGSSIPSGALTPPGASDAMLQPFLLDLRNYFPFCIPFDLYDFFRLLDADPVAPVLSWEIKDLSGNNYPISINLSEWDSVAQLFRRLQLFLFITGLAVASRKFIKW